MPRNTNVTVTLPTKRRRRTSRKQPRSDILVCARFLGPKKAD